MKLKFPNPALLAWRRLLAAVTVTVCLGAGAVQAADEGPRRYAEGAFDAATGAYTVVKGDELAAIAQRFGVTVAELKARNQLGSDSIKPDQKLVVAAGAPEAGPASAPQITGTLGSASATTTLGGNQLPPPDPAFGGVIKEAASGRSPGGRRVSCRRRARPTCC